MDVAAWKNNTKNLTSSIHDIVKRYNEVLNEWENVRNEAGDPGKHEVDDCLRGLSDARAILCSLKGGKRSRKHRRTRKHRR